MGLWNQIGSLFWGPPGIPAGLSERPPKRNPLEPKVLTSPRMPAFLPWFDFEQNLDETEQMRRAYRVMAADPNVKAALYGKVQDVMALDLEIKPASETNERDATIARFVQWALNSRYIGGSDSLCWNVLVHAAIDGISINDPVWGDQDGGEWKGKRVLRDALWIDIDQDVYLSIDEFKRLIGLQGIRYNGGQWFLPSDFLIFRNLALFNNPGGTSDLRAAYGRWWMLDTIFKLRGEGARRAAFPMPYGEYRDDVTQAQLEYMLANAESLNWAAVPAETKLGVLQLATGAAQYFEGFRRDCIEEIYQSIQFSHLQAVGGAKGSGGLGHGGHAIHKDTSEIPKQTMAEQFASWLNNPEEGLVKKIVDANFANVDAYPIAVLGKVNLEEQKARADILKILVEAGQPVSKKRTSEEFRLPLPESEEDTLKPIQMQQQSEQLDHDKQQADLNRQHEAKQGDKDRQHATQQADKDRDHQGKLADKQVEADKDAAKANRKPKGK